MLDIGTGPFALLAVIAARAGAKKVYAIEKTLMIRKGVWSIEGSLTLCLVDHQ